MSRTSDVLDALQHHLSRLVDFSKPGILVALGGAGAQLIAFKAWLFTPSLVAAAVVMHLADLVTGIIKGKLQGGLDSDRGLRGWIKVLINLSAISLVVYLYHAMPGWVSGLIQWLLVIPILTELLSIFENLSDIEDALGIKSQWIKPVLKLIGSIKSKAFEQAEQAITQIPASIEKKEARK